MNQARGRVSGLKDKMEYLQWNSIESQDKIHTPIDTCMYVCM